MRRALPIVALVVAFVMTPGALEMTENAVHLVVHGDSAHSAENAADGAGGHEQDTDTDEHGCTGTYHACSCHRSPQVVHRALTPALGPDGDSREAAMTVPEALSGSGFVREIDRPPQA